MSFVHVETAALTALISELFRTRGVSAAHAAIVSESLVSADLEGVGSHGAMLVPMYLDRLDAGSVKARAAAAIVQDLGGLVVMAAGHALGQVSSLAAVDLAVARARDHGLALVSVREAFHFGAASYWTRRIAGAGLVGFAFSNTRPLMPAPGGAERVVGNNPMSIAFPSAHGLPLVVDMAMSATAMGRIRMADTRGQPIPEGWATDAEGRPTTSAAAAIAGMLLPAAGPKGFGLAVAIDLICGALSGGAVGAGVKPLYGDIRVPYDCAHAFLAIDASRLHDGSGIGATVDAFADQIRSSKRAAGIDQVYAPGDLERARRRDSGSRCPLAAEVVAQLNARARAAGLALELPATNPSP